MEERERGRRGKTFVAVLAGNNGGGGGGPGGCSTVEDLEAAIKVRSFCVNTGE